MGHLHLALLGTPEVRHDGRLLSFRTRKTLALLIYLAVEGTDGALMHTREKLATLFWPESDRRAGRTTLRSILLHLRTALQHENTDAEGTAPHLIVERDVLGFNLDTDVELDLECLDAATTTRDLAILQQAVAVYRGDFLEGFTLPDAPEFDDWASVQREYWHRRMQEICKRLAHMQSEQGQTRDAVETATRWVALDPYNEGAYRHLIRLHVSAGDRTAALKTYDNCRHMLAEEFGVEPAPETEALVERIRREAIPQQMQPVSERTTSPLQIQLPFKGRAEEHSRLVTAFHAMRRGRAQVATIEGDAGIGKTRLAHEFLAWTRAHNARVMAGRAFESSGRLPYQPIVEALRDHVQNAGALDELLSTVWLSELSRLLPELRDRYPELRPVSDEAVAQTRMFEAVSRLGIALSHERPLVVLIDDIQWSDAASRDLLHYVTRRWHADDVSILLILGLRGGVLRHATASTAPTLTEWLASLEREVPLIRIFLERLSLDDIRHLVRSLGDRHQKAEAGEQPLLPPQSLSPERETFVEWLYAQTQGHPLYLEETLRALLEQHLLAARQDETGHWRLDLSRASDIIKQEAFVAPGVRDVVRGRLARLSDLAFNLLAAGAVLGHEFDFQTLCHVADIAPMQALSMIDDLLASRLFVETPKSGETDDPPYSFGHDKIRDIVYTEAGDARRHLYHQRAFAYLENRGAAPITLVHHAQAAGLPDAEFHYSVEAGNAAMNVFAVQEAIARYEQARRVLAEHPEVGATLEVERTRHLYEQLGRSYELQNEWEQARAVYEEMRSVAREADYPAGEVAALNCTASLTMLEDLDVDTARTRLREARDIAERAGDQRGLAQTEWGLMQAGFYAFDREAAITHGERALTLAHELSDAELIARCLNGLAYTKLGAMRFEQAEAHAREARRRFAALDNRAMEVDSLCMVGTTAIHAGRPREALPILREARALATEIDNAWGLANTGFNLAQAMFETGRWGDALAVIDEAITIAEEHDLLNLTAAALSVRGGIYRALLAPDLARADHERARDLFERQTHTEHFPRLIALDLCADYAVAGQWPEAYQYAQEVLASDGWSWLYSMFNYWAVVEALLHANELEHARAITETFAKRIDDSPRYTIPYRRSLALLARWESQDEAARDHLETAAAIAEEIGLPCEQWQVLAALADSYEEFGTTSEASAARRQAEEIVYVLADRLANEAIRVHFRAGAGQRIERGLE